MNTTKQTVKEQNASMFCWTCKESFLIKVYCHTTMSTHWRMASEVVNTLCQRLLQRPPTGVHTETAHKEKRFQSLDKDISARNPVFSYACLFCVCTSLCGHVYMWAHICGVKSSHPRCCYSRHTILLVFRDMVSSLSGRLGYLASNPPVSAFLALKLQACSVILSCFMWLLTIRPRSSYLQKIHWLCCPPAQREYTKLFFTCTYFILAFGMY